MNGSQPSALLEAMREQHTKSFERAIIDWLAEHELEDVVFYPQDNPTILVTWVTPDGDGNYLFREIDIVIEDDDLFRCAGGAIYHAPNYCLSWFPASHVSESDLPETLSKIKADVDGLGAGDLTDMEEFQASYMFRFDMN